MGAFEVISLILALAGLGSSIGGSAAKSSKTKKYQNKMLAFQKSEADKERDAMKRGALSRALLQFSGGEYDPSVATGTAPVLDTTGADIASGIGEGLQAGSAVIGSLPGKKSTTTQNVGTEPNIKGTQVPEYNDMVAPESQPMTDLAYVAPSANKKLALKRRLGIS